MSRAVKTGRNSSVEILRIVSMFLIVLSHCSFHSGFDAASCGTVNSFFVQLFTTGNLGVDIFVIISGYFLCTSSYSFKRVIRIILHTFMYSVLLYGICIVFGKAQVSPLNLIKAFLPITFKDYWFITAYVVLYIFSPYINLLLKKLSRKYFILFIAAMLLLWSVVPTFTSHDMYGNEAAKFLMLYCIGAYLRFFPESRLAQRRAAVLLIALSSAALVCTSAAKALIVNDGYFSILLDSFYGKSSVFVIGFSVGMFSLFAGFKKFSNSFINSISACTLGIYIIHENMFIKGIIWKDIVNAVQFSDKWFLPLYMLAASVAVYVVCVIIELIRISAVEPVIMKPVNKYYGAIRERIFRVIHALTRKFTGIKGFLIAQRKK